jgi:glycine hydroxymethyltransferase
MSGRQGSMRRSKVDFTALENAKCQIRNLAVGAGIDFKPPVHGYPHFYYMDDKQDSKQWAVYEIGGERAGEFLNYALSSDVEGLNPGESQATRIFTPQGEVDGNLGLVEKNLYRLSVPAGRSGLASAWLRDLSDGYVSFDEDVLRKAPGPVWIKDSNAEPIMKANGNPLAEQKPYYICMPDGSSQEKPLPVFTWNEQEGALRRTPLFDLHKELGAKVIPFAGWEMPVWYTSVMDEHLAVRQAAGVFDVAHMGVYQAEGPDAAQFLDSVVGNDASGLDVGESCYTHLLDPDANVIDDLIVYRRGQEKFLIVVNASNDDKDWTWLNAVKNGEVRVDNQRPWSRAFGRNVVLRNLRDPKEGKDMRVDIAFQGPRSRDVLLAMGVDAETRKRIMGLSRTQLCDAVVGGFNLVVSRTGYTGERMAFELFVHPERAADLFKTILKVGETYGVKPIGLGARDSLRTEAGLPLYGHEMGGENNLGVGEAGFGSYVKTYKPWFVGREAFLARELTRKGEVVRFRFVEKGVRMAHGNDPVIDKRGRVTGYVTSCAVDQEGFLTGQAFVELKNSEPETPLWIYQGAPEKAGKPPAELTLGDKTTLPAPAIVVSRFP